MKTTKFSLSVHFILSKMGIKVPLLFFLLILGCTFFNNVIFIAGYSINVIETK